MLDRRRFFVLSTALLGLPLTASAPDAKPVADPWVNVRLTGPAICAKAGLGDHV
jgi:hypothetical protein